MKRTYSRLRFLMRKCAKHVPESSYQSLYLAKLINSCSLEGHAEGISYWMVRFVFRPFLQSISNDLHVCIAAPPCSLLTLGFSSCVHHLSSPDKTNKTHFTYAYIYIYIYILVSAQTGHGHMYSLIASK